MVMKYIIIASIILYASVCFSWNGDFEKEIVIEPPVELENVALYTDGGSLAQLFAIHS